MIVSQVRAEDGEDLDDEDDLTGQAEGDADEDEGDPTAEDEDLDEEEPGARASAPEGEAGDDGARDR